MRWEVERAWRWISGLAGVSTILMIITGFQKNPFWGWLSAGAWMACSVVMAALMVKVAVMVRAERKRAEKSKSG